MPSELTSLSVAELGAAIKARRVSSVEATRACLAEIELWQPVINCFINLDAEGALASARKADAEIDAGAVARSVAWRADRVQGHVRESGKARDLWLEDLREPDHRPDGNGHRAARAAPEACCWAGSTWASSPSARPATTITSAIAATPGTPSGSPGAHRADPAPRPRHARSSPRLDRTPAVRYVFPQRCAA